MRRPLALCLLVTLIALLAGCGSDPSPGDAEPRRTLDPRAEAVRFFGANTGAIALLRTDMPRPAAEIAAVARGYPALVAALSEPERVLTGSGIDIPVLLRLGRRENGEGPGAELAVGFMPGPGGARTLVVLPTDRPEDLAGLFRSAVEEGDIESAGEYDNATLYRGPEAAFALRDGVLLAAPSVPDLRRAFAIRDGDAARRLDDGDVAAALDEVPARAPLHLIARRGDRFAAVAVRPQDGDAEFRISAEVPEDPENREGPHRVTVGPEAVEQLLITAAGLPPDTAAMLAEVAPLQGASYTDGDRYIATFTVAAP